MKETRRRQTYPRIRASRPSVRWQIREVHKITEWKDGCVYKTKSLGLVCCTLEYTQLLCKDPNVFVGPVSTWVTKLING